MKILSWNVNGLKSWIKNVEVFEFLGEQNFDIVCLQETRISQEKLFEIEILAEFSFHFYHFAEKAGYSGTAIFSKQKPINYQFGLQDIDQEGRVITLEFPDFFLVNVYTPNSKIDLSRLDYRKNVWDINFLKHIKKLNTKKEVIICGDLNVLGSDLDLQDYKFYLEDVNFQKKIAGERAGFKNMLDVGFVDTFRNLYPKEKKFSWIAHPKLRLPYTRLDYFLLSENWIKKIIDSKIEKCIGSDHLPIALELKEDFVREKNDLVEKVLFPEPQQPSLF